MRNTFVAQVATNRSNACLKLKRVDDAVSDAELAIAADASFAKAYFRRAQAYEMRGEWEAAVRDFTKVQELEREMPGIADQLKHAKAELKKSKRVDYYKVRTAEAAKTSTLPRIERARMYVVSVSVARALEPVSVAERRANGACSY